jgi:hypothetical protein
MVGATFPDGAFRALKGARIRLRGKSPMRGMPALPDAGNA